MKKIVKLLSLPVISLFLVACSNNTPAETTTVTSETTTVAPATTTEAQVSVPETTTANESTTTAVEGEETTTSEVAATDVPFKLYVNGELTKEFVAKNAVGGSILDAMSSIEGLDFTFDEEEGIISQIDNKENDYATGETWVYLLNGQYAKFGVVSQTLSEGDVIEWYYGTTDQLPVSVTQ